MASRQTAGTTSAFQYAAPASYANADIDIALSSNPGVSGGGSALSALVGTTINGQVVGPLEVWSDCAVWDTTNSRYLRPVFDFDVTLLHRSGIGC